MSRAISLLALVCLVPVLHGDDWPQWLGPQRDGVWREKGLVKSFPSDIKALWRMPIGQGYSGPAVVGDRVYVMDRLRAKDADGKPLKPTRKGIAGTERVLCLDATTGKQIWKREYDCTYKVGYPSGPRVTPIVRDGRVYALGTMGDLKCLEAKNGNVVWEKNLVAEYKLTSGPVWGYAAHPMLVGNLLYSLVGGKGSAIVAFDKDTGKEVWKALSTEEIGYSPPMLVQAAGKSQLLVWLSEALYSLDAKTGKLFWKQEYPIGGEPQRPAVNIVSIVPTDGHLFLTTFYHGPMMLQIDKDKPAAKVIWRGKSNNPSRPDGLHGLMAAPVIKSGFLYGVTGMGELQCLDAKTGKLKWKTFDLTGGEQALFGTAFLVPNGDRFVVFNDLGQLLLAELTPKGHKVISKAKVIEPAEKARGRDVVWSHPAFARKCVFIRNDKEIICISLAEKK